MKKIVLAAALSFGAAFGAQAADANAPVRFLAGAGLTFGGDNLVTVAFSDGSTDTLKAGGIFHLYAGGEFRVGDAVSLQGTIGYHVDDTRAANNGSVRFTRVPVDMLALYRVNDKVRLGAGVQWVNGPELKGSGVASNINAKFKNTTGAIVAGEYFFSPQIAGQLRYVSEEFEPQSGGGKVDGSHIGLMFNWYF
ncbi:MAG TPA: outer membrane beta-barrel protein [Albitalea sp.]|nr:outer membrane beta-barrel protein [Albitalea sp.]